MESRRLLSAVSFGPPATYAVGATQVFPIATADLNGDGHADIVTDNYGSLSILLGNGDGTLEPAHTINDGLSTDGSSGIDDLKLADVGNGHVDIFVSSGNSKNVELLLGNGDGTFSSPIAISATSTSTVDHIAVGVLGNNEVGVLTANADGTVTALLGNGDGTFRAPISIPVGAHMNSIALADFNGDGELDVVVANDSTSTAMVLLSNGTPTPGSFQLIPSAGSNVHDVSVATFDSGPALIINNKDGSSEFVASNADGTFKASRQILASGSGQVLVHADINGDGNLDLVTTLNGEAQVLFGNGDGTFGAPVDTGVAVSPDVNADAEPDLNGDGKADLVFGYDNAAKIAVRLNTTPTFAVLSNGILTVTGTASADSISATDNAGSVIATLDGVPSSAFVGVTGIIISGGAGDDTISAAGVPIHCTIGGGGGNDAITGGSISDSLKGGSGDDIIGGAGGDDSISGGSGNDSLKGGAGNDSLTGGPGNDTLHGGAGNDSLYGGVGTDSVNGNDGNDSITAGPGASQLAAGPGNDTIIGSTTTGYGFDTITLVSGDLVTAGFYDSIVGQNGTDTVNRL